MSALEEAMPRNNRIPTVLSAHAKASLACTGDAQLSGTTSSHAADSTVGVVSTDLFCARHSA